MDREEVVEAVEPYGTTNLVGRPLYDRLLLLKLIVHFPQRPFTLTIPENSMKVHLAPLLSVGIPGAQNLKSYLHSFHCTTR